MVSASTSIGQLIGRTTHMPAMRHIPNIVDLSLMELRKLLRRPMVWAIFALPSVLGMAYFPIAYLVARAQGMLASAGPHLYPPGFIEGTFSVLLMLGTICVAVLAAGLIGSDYSWGTMRVQVATGVPRGQLLAGKLVALGVALAAWLMTSLAAATISSVVVTVVSRHPLSFGHVDAAWFGELGLMFSRTWLLLAAWMSMAVAASVIGRSLAAGIAVPIVWQVLEGILSNVLGFAGHIGTQVSRLLLVSSAASFNIHNVFGPAKVIPGTVSQAHATAVICGYMVITLVTAIVIFVRRDFGGAA